MGKCEDRRERPGRVAADEIKTGVIAQADFEDSREKLKADVDRLVRHGFITFKEIVELLDRQAEITRRTEQAEWIKQANGLIHEANVRAAELEAERDEAVEAYDVHMAAHDAWHEAEDIEYTRNRFAIYEQATKERVARLESERDALAHDLEESEKLRDELREKLGAAIGHAVEITRLQDLEVD